MDFKLTYFSALPCGANVVDKAGLGPLAALQVLAGRQTSFTLSACKFTRYV